MIEKLTDYSRLAVHTMTTKPWSLAECIDAYAKAGIRAISVWRNVLEPIEPAAARRMLADAAMRAAALVRGGFFVAAAAPQRQKAIDENRRCIDQASAIGAEMVVLVVGAVAGISSSEGRQQVTDGIAAVLQHAQDRQVKLAIEPLHPMYAADRSCVNRMVQAREICDQLQHPLLGIAVDVYHVWWDPDLQSEIAMAGARDRLFAFHLCDWLVDTSDLLNDRGLMGAGCIDLRTIRHWMQSAGFGGYNEVEIFSNRNWQLDQREYLQMIMEAYLESC